MNKNLFCVLPALALLLGSCGSRTEDKGNAETIVKVAQVAVVSEYEQWQLPGRVKAAKEVNLAFKVSGTLKRIAVSEGQRVSAGQVVAEMDDTDYRVQLQATEAEYDGIKAEAERVMALYNQQGTTASNNDKARYGLRQIEAKLAHHRNQLAYCQMTSPVSGTVQTTYFEAGETVGQGMPVLQIISSGAPEMEVSLPQGLGATLKNTTGLTATATFGAYPDKVFVLNPLEILPKANATGLYTMRLQMQGTALPSPGMSGWVTLSMSHPDKVERQLRVPATALCHTQEGDHVFVVAGGKANKVPVSVLSIDGNGMATVTGNLQPETAIVATGVHHISDGQLVKPLPPTSSTNKGALL